VDRHPNFHFDSDSDPDWHQNDADPHRIHMFLGLLDPYPDPLVRGMDSDPDPSII
jgi:hypothetical protein